MKKATRVAALAAGCLVLAGCGGGGGGPDNPISPSSSSSSSSSAAVGKYLYIANTGSDSITAYSINAATGALTAIPGTPFNTGTGLGGVVVDPSGKYLYTTNQGGNLANASVSGFAISATTGALSSTNGPYSLGAFSTTPPDGPIFQPAGNFLYVRKSSESKTYGFSLDKNNGTLTALAGMPLPTGGFPGRFNTTNGRYYIHTGSGAGTAISVYTVDNVTGQSTFVDSRLTGQNSPGFIFFYANKYLYSLSFTDKTLATFAINQTDGTLTAVGPVTTLTGSVFPYVVLVHSSGKFLYVLDQNINLTTGATLGPSSIYTFSINSTTGVLSQVGSPVSTGGERAIGMSIYPNGNYLLVTNNASPGSVAIFGIDQTSGVLTQAVNSPFQTPSTSPSFVTIDPSGKFAYLPDRASQKITQFTINATTGMITTGPDYPTGTNPLIALIVGSQ